ncbi:MAG: cation:proton antiporter [Chitinivibrionales bacterium]|nr:cation:proton antiporter [Chitinivibrionales bacterium]MBD3358304.1 cation:proton antiporter [Chitinivibrionales bacterium]
MGGKHGRGRENGFMGIANTGHALTLLLVGLLVPFALLGKALARRVGMPPLTVWIMVGLVTRLTAEPLGLLNDNTEETLRFLSELGVAILLFRIGMESKLARLAGKLGQASLVWSGNVLISGLAGYATAYYLIGLEAAASIVIGVAMTATSVGVTVGTWREGGKINTSRGQLLLDVAELDDVSSIVLMGLLFAMFPIITGQADGAVARTVFATTLLFVVRMAAFSLLCVLFARYLEGPITAGLTNLEHGPDPMLSVASMGLIIAAIAGIAGFSIALGAFFAGLAFSRDPEAVALDASFDPLYELFTPFFFIYIGMSLKLGHGTGFPAIAAILLIGAVGGKVVGAFIPGAVVLGRKDALLFGASLIPRAEITMIVMNHARASAPETVTATVYTAMTAVSIASCLIAPPVARHLLRKEDKRGKSFGREYEGRGG